MAEFPAVLLAEEATEFVQNVAEGAAPKGGALLVIDSPKTVRLKGAEFGANMVRALSGTGCGGAVSVDLGGDVRLDDCEFHDNTALMASDMAHDASGGAICVGLNGRAWLVAGKMWSNQAGGGAPVHLLMLHSARQLCHDFEPAAFVLQLVSSTLPRCIRRQVIRTAKAARRTSPSSLPAL